MKQLSVEEKAKRYDEAIEIIKSKWHYKNQSCFIDFAKIFPELVESEDKMIKKEFCKDIWNYIPYEKAHKYIVWLEKQCEKDSQITLPQFTFDDILALQCCMETVKKVQEDKDLYKKLEDLHSRVYDAYHFENQGKQKASYTTLIETGNGGINALVTKELPTNSCDDEKKPTDKVEPKFHEGEWVIDKQGIMHQITKVIENVVNHTYGYDIVGGGYFNDNTEGVRLWTIQDAKDGDVLSFDNIIVIFKDLYKSTFHSYCYIEHEVFCISKNNISDWWEGKEFHPATKEQRDTLMKAMADAGYIFDFEKKELKKIEQMPTWSEEDEAKRNALISLVEEIKNQPLRRLEDWDGYISWLRFLKGRVQPQPKQVWSEEDEMIALSIEQVMNCASLLNIAQEKVDKIKTWLKSLKDRYTWKPSDEQIKVCKEVYADILSAKGFDLGTVNSELNRLEEQLKKLKG